MTSAGRSDKSRINQIAIGVHIPGILGAGYRAIIKIEIVKPGAIYVVSIRKTSGNPVVTVVVMRGRRKVLVGGDRLGFDGRGVYEWCGDGAFVVLREGGGECKCGDDK